MGFVLGIPVSADPAERRTPIVPDVANKLRSLGATLLIQRGATDRAHLTEFDLGEVTWAATTEEVIAGSDVVWTIGPPAPEALAALRRGTILIGTLAPFADAERVRALAAGGVDSFAMELLPRISRAQSMDILSSQGAASGYQCALIAAARCPKFFPMLTYAAGTVRPARVLVIGAGVAGLQAIATAKRLGAIVEGYDVRPETREQIESLGAKFVDTGVAAVGEGGYARELTEAEKGAQEAKLGKAIAQCDVLITTAAVPGKRAPRIVSEMMVNAMRPGAVVVDMAAEQGGNVYGTVAGSEVRVGPAHIVGPVNLPSRMPVHTSEMFAKNLYNFTAPMVTDGSLAIDLTDEVIAGTALTLDGAVASPLVARVLGLGQPSPEQPPGDQPQAGRGDA
ncbi:NAD(P) transhydrogenase subunit alpha [Micropruina sonneratiae]|uniref:NAD(P) transhydrogenase subunit alpha n=1 Tax=Micropruina sonneratiae TaxID=2986940 RepID=UPI002226F9FC|nr:NAD(P) transhydrogenase subunit alpha [Micropruina sp. KQZ13P-5]MCW3157307.1 NAD(P) transhydrogenase subunit alpha [Micropruina sp. KQZ13P-5]